MVMVALLLFVFWGKWRQCGEAIDYFIFFWLQYVAALLLGLRTLRRPKAILMP